MMKKKILFCMLIVSITLFSAIPIFADDLSNVQDFLAELNGNGGSFQVSEFSVGEEKNLHIVTAVDFGNENAVDFFDKRHELFEKMSQQDWFKYKLLYEDVFTGSRNVPLTSSVWDFSNDELLGVMWGGYVSVESISTKNVLKMSGYAEDVQAAKESIPENDEEMTLGQENALQKAYSYLAYTSFSYTGLIEQLEFEQFSHEDAAFAADNCGADWNEQAAKKAESYLEYTSFSRDGLIQQLEFEGFTKEQAEYGVAAVGY